jgi:hypothetical protein
MYAAHLRVHLYIPPFSLRRPVHPEHRKLDQRHRLTRQREVRQLACPQSALREREDDVPHARPELRVRHERREPYCGARKPLHERVRRRAHAERDAGAV